jgi:hypothetical protein
VYSAESHLMFQRNTLALSSELKNKPSKKPASGIKQSFAFYQLDTAEHGGDIFLLNISCLSADYSVLYHGSVVG